MKKTKLEKAGAKAELAKNEAAAGTEFLADYRTVNGVKLYYCTVAHKWILLKLNTEQYQQLDDAERGLVIAYVLSWPPKSQWSDLIRVFRVGNVCDKALAWAIEKQLDPSMLGVINELMRHPYADMAEKGTDENPPAAGSNITGGAD